MAEPPERPLVPVEKTTYIFNMKNRFRDDWNDKVQQEVTGNGFQLVIQRKGE